MFSNATVGETVEALAAASTIAEGHVVMRRALSAFDLKHFSYIALRAAPRPPPLVVTTYSAEWQMRYLGQGYIRVDPVIGVGTCRVLPFDWETLDRSERRVRSFFGEAGEHDVGARGMTFPFRGVCGERALFSANTDVDPRRWRALRGLLTDEFLSLSCYFHAWASARSEATSRAGAQRLSARERDCLAWCAAGKSTWDISAILGVSERTVRFHLANARRKLDAATTIHAVAEAIRHAAISLP